MKKNNTKQLIAVVTVSLFCISLNTEAQTKWGIIAGTTQANNDKGNSIAVPGLAASGFIGGVAGGALLGTCIYFLKNRKTFIINTNKEF